MDQQRPLRRLTNEEGLRERGILFSRAHRHRLIKAGKFPAPVKVGANRNAWVLDEIEAWIDERIADRDRGAGGH